MDKYTAIDVLKEFNEWRQGADTKMLHPKIITKAINKAIEEMEKQDKKQCLTAKEIQALKDKKNKIIKSGKIVKKHDNN